MIDYKKILVGEMYLYLGHRWQKGGRLYDVEHPCYEEEQTFFPQLETIYPGEIFLVIEKNDQYEAVKIVRSERGTTGWLLSACGDEFPVEKFIKDESNKIR